jgi:hypothetical protein
MTKPISREKSPLVACTVSGATNILYTCPPNCVARVPLVFITNANGNVTVNFKIYKAANTTSYFIIGGKNLGLGDFIQLSDNTGLILEAGDRLEVIATGATVNVDALCTVVEQFKPVG